MSVFFYLKNVLYVLYVLSYIKYLHFDILCLLSYIKSSSWRSLISTETSSARTSTQLNTSSYVTATNDFLRKVAYLRRMNSRKKFLNIKEDRHYHNFSSFSEYNVIDLFYIIYSFRFIQLDFFRRLPI